MTLDGMRIRRWMAQQWFWPVAALLVLSDVLVVKLFSEGMPALVLERAVLADFCLVAPLLYALCFRRDGKKILLRMLALAGLGLYLASKLLPVSDAGLIAQLYPLRYLGMGVMALIEIKVLWMIYSTMFRGDSPQSIEQKLLAEGAMAPWMAKMLAMEAAFWRAVWRHLRALFRRD